MQAGEQLLERPEEQQGQECEENTDLVGVDGQNEKQYQEMRKESRKTENNAE